jgi:beta-N-acetylhexosaminidase
VAGDSHLTLPVIDVDLATLRSRELLPFRSGIAAGARLVMLGHLAVPAVTGTHSIPATLAPELSGALLRDELGFQGVSVTDALDMGALASFGSLPELAVRAALAGDDLLLTAHEAGLEDEAIAALTEAIHSGRLGPVASRAAARRVQELRRWVARRPAQPALTVLRSAEHLELARETAERSITLLRDQQGFLPLRPGQRLVVVAPAPADLTPADTSSYLSFGLADAVRAEGFPVDEIVLPMDPTDLDVGSVRIALARGGSGPGPVALVGTIDALVHTGQARLVEVIVAAGTPTIAVALRTPVDLAAYPRVRSAIATYGLQPPTLRALAAALAGSIPFRGRLPVRLPALMERQTGAG